MIKLAVLPGSFMIRSCSVALGAVVSRYNTMNQKEFFIFFEKFQQLEKQRAFEPKMN